ncbi:MAG: hypothetical protein LBF36_03055, partial [Mycoplasmataceae bacterium]|nr:hypothetical protein [Mycoplasmataceae bacterium]
MKKILKNIIPPAIVVAGASTIIATSATSCGTKSIEVNTTIDVYYDLSNNVWQTVENTYSEKRVIDDYNIIVTTIANKKPIGTY